MGRRRDVTDTPPRESGRRDGLAYALWHPAGALGGVIVLHGAGSAKESHFDFARLLDAAGLAAVVFDARGHGGSDSPMDGRALDDIMAMGSLLRERLGDARAPLALRGSSMGGYFALLGAAPLAARAVVAICPASAEGLRAGLREGRFAFAADADALDGFLATHELDTALAAMQTRVLLLHAEGDEVVPIAHSRELARRLGHCESRLVAVPGGHHRSIQHDPELQAISLRYIQRAFRG